MTASPDSAEALMDEIRALQAHGVSDDDIPVTIIANELHLKGWLIADIARSLRLPVSRILILLGLSL
jgi:hypothetical protein